MNTTTKSFVELLPLVLMFAVLVLLLAIFQRKLGNIRTGRNGSLQFGLPLRSPGASVLNQFERAVSEYNIFGVAVAVVPLTLLLSYLTYLYLSKTPAGRLDLIYLVCLLVGFLLYGTNKLRRLDAKKKRLLRTFAGIQMVAQEINRLSVAGYHVYHDFPSGRFHIDHVVVGPTGVFAVRSRIPSCLDRVARDKPHPISAAGEILTTKKATDTTTIRTTVFHAAWLANWLLTAAGDAVRVQPLLTLPGYRFEFADNPEIVAVDPTRIVSTVRANRASHLGIETIQRLRNEIERKYRRASGRSGPG
jgi:hypothetical protein